ncbi:hypothetical protein V8B97DRAFT_1872651 [Scleroderma yunnanense]
MTGRIPDAVLNVLNEGFQQINDHFSVLEAHVGMPSQQVIDCTKQFGCSNLSNCWNRYQEYFAKHSEQELARLPSDEENTLTPTKTFLQLERTSKIWRTWAALWLTYHAFIDCTLIVFLQFSALSKVHAIKGTFVLAGSVFNQDGGLGFVYTTPCVENFFTEHCHASDDEIIGHFKVHI